MKTEFIKSVKECLEGNISDPGAFFIFSTDIASRTWADWCVIKGKSRAVALERFMAWDSFKGTFLRAREEGKTAVPSMLRKLFVHDFIRRNAEKSDDDPTKLKKIIAPQFADTAGAFSDYLSKNLSSLNLWHARMEQYKNEYGTWDLEDRDYKILYDEYKNFLEKNKLFEPSWVQDVRLEESEKKFFIIFPELLEDFEEYSEIFSDADNVTACFLNGDIPDPASYEYPDSRSELRQTMLQIIDLVHRQKKCDWTDIALSVADLDTYRPYLEREFKLYDIPFVIRAGLPLTKNTSARIFESIQNCYKTDFSYDSVRTLLLDECIPWKDKTVLPLSYTEDGKLVQKKIEVDLTKTRESLIRHGNELHCVFPYEEKNEDGTRSKIDTWIKSLHAQRRGHSLAGLKDQEKKDEEELALYTAIKNCVTNFYRTDEESSGFETVLSSWFQFKERFINESDFSSDSNKILSRCIVHLQEMAELEREYCLPGKMQIPMPYDFFVRELSQKKYTPQTSQRGISIFEYKLSAEACFECQFLINASQKQVDVQYKKLEFLNSTKRAKLRLLQKGGGNQITKTFVHLYTQASEDFASDLVHISSAVQSFDGFAIPHSCLNVKKESMNLDQSDYILREKNWIASSCSEPIDMKDLPKAELESLSLWKRTSRQKSSIQDSSIIKEMAGQSLIQAKDYSIKNAIQKYTEEIKLLEEKKRDGRVLEFLKRQRDSLEKFNKPPYDSMPKVTARGELEYFYPCPRRWTLSRLLMIRPDSLDISLIKNYEIGNLNHSVLEEFMKKYIGDTLPHYDELKNAFTKDGVDVSGKMKEEIGEAADKAVGEFSKSPLVKKIFSMQKEQLSDSLYDFLTILLIPYGSGLDKKGERTSIAGIGGCTVYGVENSFIMPSENEGYLCYGVIDCLLRAPRTNDPDSEGWIIIDYKSSSSSIPKANEVTLDENGRINDFQMPMYVSLILSQSDESGIDAAYFYSVKRESPSSNQKRAVIDRHTHTEKKDLTQKSYEPVLKKFREYRDEFIEKCMGNPEPYISYDESDKFAVRMERDCISCDLKSICRTSYTIANRRLRSRKEVKK